MDRRLTRKTGIYVVVGLVLVGSVLMLITTDPLFSGLLGAAPAVDSCTTIDEPGRYELTKDITASDENNCIEITASNVILDGREHTINLDTLTPDR